MGKIKKIWDIVSSIIVIFMVLSAMFLMGARVIGYQVFSVLSGSMEPQFSVGDLIYVKEVDPSEVKVGDAITFVLNEDLVVATHQVVRIDEQNKHFYTKGLANETEDTEPVHFNNLIGRAEYGIPLLGYVSNFIQTSPGIYITIAGGIIMFALVFLPDLLPKKKEDPVVSDAEAENAKLKQELEALRSKLKQNSMDE
jgi:signal peptidase